MNSNEYFKEALVVIVLYKMQHTDSETFNTLKASLHHASIENGDILVYDNSPTSQIIEPLDKNNLFYFHDPSNPGVSKAYNCACKLARQRNKRWLLIFDQDTKLPLNAISVYSDALQHIQPDIKVIAPRLVGQKNVILSPCRFIFHRGFHFSKVNSGRTPLRHKSFLNSGLMVAIEAIENTGGFDENLFYYSDHDFFKRLSEKYQSAQIIDLNLCHDMASSRNEDSDATKKRLIFLKKGSIAYAKKHNTLLPILWLLLRSLKLVISTKNAEYLLIALSDNE